MAYNWGREWPCYFLINHEFVTYIIKKIISLDFASSFATMVLVLSSLIIGRFFMIDDIRSWKFYLMIFILSVISIVVSELVQYFDKKSKNYLTGKKGEDYVAKLLDNIPGLNYERNVKIKNGDLDFLVYAKHAIYGLEVKNMSGKITYNNQKGVIVVNKHSQNILNQVKAASGEVQKVLSEKDKTVKFVQPVVVFCDHRAYVDVPNNKVTSNGVDVYVIGTSQLKEFFK